MPVKSGTLGGGNLAAGAEVMAYECQAPATAATATVSFCNKTGGNVRVRLAIGPGPDTKAPGTVFLEYDAPMEPNEPLERTGIAVSVGRKIFVRSDKAEVDYYISGYEKEAI
ncbi:hypothetical protein [Massilia sp. CCM 8734]|uniref:hypothetical protein n=1 Tax=Massilia sp. CCM 8734 TaxID=2609283 RepID=UPI00141F69B1|nr:hypothetical protein [Massilia sp. CCM 8734]NIA00859.1 hypothetical protein [Massilia sp. CCM 8734]